MKNERFILMFKNCPRPPMSFTTKAQLNSFLNSVGLDVTQVSIFRKEAEAVRDDWMWKFKHSRRVIRTPRSHVRWTPEETCECLEMHKKGVTYAQIAEHLGRTPGAVAQHICLYQAKK